ncbi:DUF167 family protein [Methanopyrus kandleri]
MESPVKEHREGTLIRVRVNPDADTTDLKGIDEWRGVLEVDVAAPPVKGKANRELLEFLGRKLNTTCELVSGEKSREKLVLARDVSVDEVKERLGLR